MMPMKIDPSLNCPCKGHFLVTAFAYDRPPEGETRFDLKGQIYRRHYDRCTVCGHWFARHDLDLSGLYERDYVTATYGGLEGMRQKFETIMALPPEKSDNRQRVQRVRAFASCHGLYEANRPRLLDVGAGIGVFPAAMKANGWHVTALEPDPRAIAHLRSAAGVDTFDKPLLEFPPVGLALFDAVTFNKVLEHVPDPLELLTAAKALLLQHGFIYVEVPDVAAAAEGPEREEFYIEHLHVFSPASLHQMVERAGFQTVHINRIREPSGKYSLYGFFMDGQIHA
jgi:SAM-dependent methyltransferase